MHSGFADRPVFREPRREELLPPEPPQDEFLTPRIPRGLRNPEVEFGGADAVPKTTYGSPLGAEPVGTAENTRLHQRKGEGTVTARVGPSGGLGMVVWITAALAVIAAVLYAAGIFI